MRTAALIIGILGLLLCFAGCDPDPATPPTVGQTTTEVPVTPPANTEPDTEPTVPHINTDFLGIDLYGMTPEQALQTVKDTIALYRLQITVNDKEFSFTAEELSLEVSDHLFYNWFTSSLNREPTNILLFDTKDAANRICQALTNGLQNAEIEYNTKTGRFAIRGEKSGTGVEQSALQTGLDFYVKQLIPTGELTMPQVNVAPAIVSTDPRLIAALDQANSYLDTSLSYALDIPGGKKTTVKLTKSTIASFIVFDDELRVCIDPQAVRAYVSMLAGKHGGNTKKDNFSATSGRTVNMTVTYYGAVLDQAAMREDLLYCLENRISETRNAQFITVENPTMPYGGNYVEVDIINQTLWLYQDGKLVVTTPFVSGNLSSGARTPTGDFTIYKMKTDCWLTGRTFRDYVDYWIAFNGNIGMHDASWRQDFGGEIFKYTGSHGCINMPTSIAGDVYHNVTLGTRVIVHGFVPYPDFMDQELSGTQQYNVTTQALPFALDIGAKYPATVISYKSSNTDVVTVDDQGIVTVTGPGEATITVTSAAVGVMRGDTLKIQITVSEGEIPESE